MTLARHTRFPRVALLFCALAAAQSVVGAAAGQGAGRAGQADTLVAEGVAALERGDAASARALFEKALSADPKDASAHTYLGLLADQAGDLEGAARHFAEAARLDPSASKRNNYGVILMRLGRTREAAAEFEASLRADPRQPSALVNLAQIRFAGGTPDDLKAAADLFARAYAIAPEAAIARAQTVVALRRKDPKGAAAHYQAFAAHVAKEGAAAAGGAADRAELGGALLEAGLLAEAEAELSAAIALEPANADALVRLARVHLARKDIPAAGRTLEAAVARGVDAAPVYAALAEIYEQSGHPENAIPAMRLAIQRDPKSEEYRFGYGMLLTNAYAPAAAVIRLDEALKLFPDSPRLWFALGLAHFKQDKDAEATQALNRAIELDPKFAPAYAYLGMIRVRGGAYEEGIAQYERALEIDPNLAAAHYLIGEAVQKQADGDPARGEAHLKRAIELDATFTPARLSLARLYMRAERWTEAVAELEEVKRRDPDVAEAYYHLGRAYARLKRTEESREALATFENLNQTQKQREDAELKETVQRLGNVRF
jgi:tetratricopeptide (TPR) repeat protein